MREHPVEGRPRPGFHSMRTSATRGVVRASYRVEKAIRLGSVPSPHENDRLSWADRQIVRCAGDDTELEHHNRHRADFERRRQESQGQLNTACSCSELAPEARTRKVSTTGTD